MLRNFRNHSFFKIWILLPSTQLSLSGSWPLASTYSRVSSRFFDQPGHEILKRSIINQHLFINAYHHRRPQNLQQGLRSFPKLEFQKWIVLNIFDKNRVDTVTLGPIDEKKMIFELITHFEVNFLMIKFFKNHKKGLFSKWKSKLALKCT